jgi:hypothetical protein
MKWASDHRKPPMGEDAHQRPQHRKRLIPQYRLCSPKDARTGGRWQCLNSELVAPERQGRPEFVPASR